MEIKNIKVADIIPYAKNQKKHPDSQVKNIATSIKKYGFVQPVVLDANNEVVIGHGRILAAKKLKLDTVPCVYADGLTDEQIRELRIIDNKLNESEWDLDFLKLDLSELDFSDFDLDFGIDAGETEIEEDAVPEVDESAEPKAKYGDVYKLGEHRLMCGDSAIIADVEKLMNGEKADMIHTDPPYGIFMHRSKTIKNDEVDDEKLKNLINDAISNAVLVSKQNVPLYCWIGWRGYSIADEIVKKYFKINNCIVWIKPSIGLGGNGYRCQHELCIFSGNIASKSESDVWYAKRDCSHLHPTMKPVELVAKAIENSSDKGDIVLDLFGGSGSTLIASEHLERKCRMMELDPHYVDVIIERWETLTGRKAELIEKE